MVVMQGWVCHPSFDVVLANFIHETSECSKFCFSAAPIGGEGHPKTEERTSGKILPHWPHFFSSLKKAGWLIRDPGSLFLSLPGFSHILTAQHIQALSLQAKSWSRILAGRGNFLNSAVELGAPAGLEWDCSIGNGFKSHLPCCGPNLECPSLVHAVH